MTLQKSATLLLPTLKMANCLLLICGIPGAGKTFFANVIRDSLQEPHQKLQDLMVSCLGFVPTPVYKNFDEVERMHLNSVSHTVLDEDKLLCWHMARSTVFTEVDRVLTEGAHGLLIILDDNFYYRSMRYKYFQLARKHKIGILTIVVECELAKAIERNEKRDPDIRVQQGVIERMNAIFEIPNHQNAWERNFFRFQLEASTAEIVKQNVPWQDIISCWMSPEKGIIDENEQAKEKDREHTKESFIHQLDLVLRQQISKAACEWKIKKEKSGGIKAFMDACNGARREVLALARRCCVEFSEISQSLPPMEPSDISLQGQGSPRVLKDLMLSQFNRKINYFLDDH